MKIMLIKEQIDVYKRQDYNKRSFLFTGDVQYAAQKKIIETKGSSISNIDVLKVPHHGHTNSVYGNTGHSENYELFAKVNPVISIVQQMCIRDSNNRNDSR